MSMNPHEHDDAQGLIRLWVSTHSNGWEAWVAQHDDGTFTCWACRPTEDAVALYIEDSFEHACAAAMFDLGRLSRHEACGPDCRTWEEREPPAPKSVAPDGLYYQ
jgi:hypothetical protein